MADMYDDCVTVKKCIAQLKDTVAKESGQTDESIVATYIERAYMSICNYLWCDELPRRLIPAVGALAPVLVRYTEQSATGYVSQKTQGSRSVSYQYSDGAKLDKYGLTAAVRAMLPLPRLRCF